jgi:YD repeat-containing protein
MVHSGAGFTVPFAQTYDADGRRKSVTDASGTTTFYYDPTGRLVREENPRGVAQYTYDNVGNRQTKTVTDTSGVRTSFVTATTTTTGFCPYRDRPARRRMIMTIAATASAPGRSPSGTTRTTS